MILSRLTLTRSRVRMGEQQHQPENHKETIMNLIEKLTDSITTFRESTIEDTTGQWKQDADDAYATEMNALIRNLDQGSHADAEYLTLEYVSSNNLDEITEMVSQASGSYSESVPPALHGRYVAQSDALSIMEALMTV